MLGFTKQEIVNVKWKDLFILMILRKIRKCLIYYLQVIESEPDGRKDISVKMVSLFWVDLTSVLQAQ